jgi:hypothetical protein
MLVNCMTSPWPTVFSTDDIGTDLRLEYWRLETCPIRIIAGVPSRGFCVLTSQTEDFLRVWTLVKGQG